MRSGQQLRKAPRGPAGHFSVAKQREHSRLFLITRRVYRASANSCQELFKWVLQGKRIRNKWMRPEEISMVRSGEEEDIEHAEGVLAAQ